MVILGPSWAATTAPPLRSAAAARRRARISGSGLRCCGSHLVLYGQASIGGAGPGVKRVF